MTLFRKESEASLTGTGTPTAWDVIEWLRTLPPNAILDFKGTSTHVGEFGVEPWRIHARWETQGPESASFQEYLAEQKKARS